MPGGRRRVLRGHRPGGILGHEALRVDQDVAALVDLLELRLELVQGHHVGRVAASPGLARGEGAGGVDDEGVVEDDEGVVEDVRHLGRFRLGDDAGLLLGGRAEVDVPGADVAVLPCPPTGPPPVQPATAATTRATRVTTVIRRGTSGLLTPRVRSNWCGEAHEPRTLRTVMKCGRGRSAFREATFAPGSRFRRGAGSASGSSRVARHPLTRAPIPRDFFSRGARRRRRLGMPPASGHQGSPVAGPGSRPAIGMPRRTR